MLYNRWTSLLAAAMILVLVIFGHLAGIKSYDDSLPRQRDVTLLGLERSTVYNEDRKPVQYWVGIFQDNDQPEIGTFKMPADDGIVARWYNAKTYQKDDSVDPRVHLILDLPRTQMYTGTFNPGLLHWMAFIGAAILFYGVFVQPLVIHRKEFEAGMNQRFVKAKLQREKAEEEARRIKDAQYKKVPL
jgi:hypothetical protein